MSIPKVSYKIDPIFFLGFLFLNFIQFRFLSTIKEPMRSWGFLGGNLISWEKVEEKKTHPSL